MKNANDKEENKGIFILSNGLSGKTIVLYEEQSCYVKHVRRLIKAADVYLVYLLSKRENKHNSLVYASFFLNVRNIKSQLYEAKMILGQQQRRLHAPRRLPINRATSYQR